ncbi:MAG: hypothetical protein DI626_11300 [Micavibrio aeruginosavorus]|uniref:Uncharacterized protein n=1 Tax=Micavibrio aeruginosavorus TaxID=349221 RepID=A0A2W4ZDA7_9BACT|nr:MAG: hypothetical protein DI626_11300 [Micavibrio aeruginosavorus]
MFWMVGKVKVFLPSYPEITVVELRCNHGEHGAVPRPVSDMGVNHDMGQFVKNDPLVQPLVLALDFNLGKEVQERVAEYFLLLTQIALINLVIAR